MLSLCHFCVYGASSGGRRCGAGAAGFARQFFFLLRCRVFCVSLQHRNNENDNENAQNMKKKQLYHPPQLTVATVRTEHCFESAPLGLNMGFENRTKLNDAWGGDVTESSVEEGGDRWYY